MKEVSASEPRLFEEHLLLREMTHRINNEFASAIGFVSVIASRSASYETRAALASVKEHLHNYAGVHRALEMPAGDKRIDAAKYVRGLCESVSRSKLQYQNIQLTFVEHPLQLSAEQCWRVGLIIFELITNASRHAFHKGGGLIRIELLKRGSCVECSVSDNGSAPENVQPGQGLTIVRSLAHSLHG
jgi:two-component sensor histidine kinase